MELGSDREDAQAQGCGPANSERTTKEAEDDDNLRSPVTDQQEKLQLTQAQTVPNPMPSSDSLIPGVPKQGGHRAAKQGRVRRRFTPITQPSIMCNQSRTTTLKTTDASADLTFSDMTLSLISDKEHFSEQVPSRRPLEAIGQAFGRPFTARDNLLRHAKAAGVSMTDDIPPLPEKLPQTATLPRSAVGRTNVHAKPPVKQPTSSSKNASPSQTSFVRGSHPAVHRGNPKTDELRSSARNLHRVTKAKPRARLVAKPCDDSTESHPQQQPAISNALLSEADLLDFLDQRARHDQAWHENIRSLLEQKEDRLLEGEEINTRLNDQLRAFEAREKQYLAEQRRYQTLGQEWKTKIGKLEAYLQGLSRDHNRLRDDAKEIDKEKRDATDEKKQIGREIEEVRSACMVVDRQRTEERKVMTEARLKIALLEQTVRNQEGQMADDHDTIQFERGRTERLQQEVTQIMASQDRMAEILRGYRDTMTERFDEILVLERNSIAETTSREKEHTKIMKDRCEALLHRLESTHSVAPEDLQNLDMSIKSYAERYVTLISRSNSSDSSDTESQKPWNSPTRVFTTCKKNKTT